jgi:AraC-like DNA-binding protein
MLFDRLLDGLDVAVSAFAICEVRRDASLVLEDDASASIHYVLEGRGFLRSMTGPEVALAPHTVLIAPPKSCLFITCGHEREMSLPAPRCKPLPGGWEWATVGDGAPGVVLACGALHATHRQTTGLFDYLRAPLIESVAENPMFRQSFEQLLDELATPRPGTRALAETLMKQCLIVLLRRHVASGHCQAPWLAALEQPRLGPAVNAMLDAPEAPHSLESLAERAGMSRAAFAERFRATFERSPMAFLRDLRLRRAARLLAGTDLPVKTVAGRVGFASRSHFSRAFKASFGADPAAYRAAAWQGTRSEHGPTVNIQPL